VKLKFLKVVLDNSQ